MESLDPQLIAKALEDMRKHLELLQEQFSKLLPQGELAPKGKGWLVNALKFDLENLRRGLGIPPDDEK
jgi:hypothetical protein